MIADFILDTIIFVLNNTILKILPVEISGFTLDNFTGYFDGITTTLQSSFNMINNFVDLKLLFGMFAFIIVAEIALHFGFKAVKFIINVFRGSGG
jgi:hypothetical protein